MKDFFETKEFECQCGCGQVDMQDHFLEKLNMARSIADIPFVITSGFRCKSYNEALVANPNIYASKTSPHLDGIAADIHCTNSADRYKIIIALHSVGLNRIGIAKTFVHADGRDQKMIRVY